VHGCVSSPLSSASSAGTLPGAAFSDHQIPSAWDARERVERGWAHAAGNRRAGLRVVLRVASCAILLAALAGCSTHIEVTRPDGTRVVVDREGYDTKIGALRIEKRVESDGGATRPAIETLRVELEDLSSEARALRLAEEAVKAAGAAAGGVR
jgi:hypothetical protein